MMDKSTGRLGNTGLKPFSNSKTNDQSSVGKSKKDTDTFAWRERERGHYPRKYND